LQFFPGHRFEKFNADWHIFFTYFLFFLIFGIDLKKKNWPSRPRDQGHRFWRLKRVDFDFLFRSFYKIYLFSISSFNIFNFFLDWSSCFYFFIFYFVGLSQSKNHDRRVSELTQVDSNLFFLFFFQFYPLIFFSLRICFIVFFVCLLCYQSQSHDHNHEFQWFIWVDFGFLGFFNFFNFFIWHVFFKKLIFILFFLLSIHIWFFC